ncbi:hypothetical protein [Sulfurimonas sp.]
MVKFYSTTRLFSIETKVILTQTDTTVGFLSQNGTKLSHIKSRSSKKPFIKVYTNFQALREDNIRVPNSKKNLIRRRKKTTFIVKHKSFRVAQTTLHSSVLRKLKWNYSTSANEQGKEFSRTFCEEKADIIIEDKNRFCQNRASVLFKINNKKIKRLR